MCMNIEIASIIFEICIVPDYFWHGTTPGPNTGGYIFFSAAVSPRRSAGNHPVRYGTFLKLV